MCLVKHLFQKINNQKQNLIKMLKETKFQNLKNQRKDQAQKNYQEKRQNKKLLNNNQNLLKEICISRT